jgi:hypothetical protein
MNATGGTAHNAATSWPPRSAIRIAASSDSGAGFPAHRASAAARVTASRACELLSARGAEVCYCAYTYLEDWYAQLGFTRWRGYTMARARLR